MKITPHDLQRMMLQKLAAPILAVLAEAQTPAGQATLRAEAQRQGATLDQILAVTISQLVIEKIGGDELLASFCEQHNRRHA